MIHSLAGGRLGKEQYLDFALVELVEGEYAGAKAWYISKIGLKQGDCVIVPYKTSNFKAKIIRIDKNVSSYASPIPVKMAKQIIKKV